MTQLRAFGAFTGAAYGAFSGKAASTHPVGRITQPRAFGPFTGRRYGSFAGRAPASGTHPVGVLTQPRAFGAFTGRRYGSFAGRVSTQPPGVVFHGPGGVRIPFKRVRRDEEEEIMALIFAFLQTQQ